MALVNSEGVVENVISYDPALPEERQFKPPVGYQLIPTNGQSVSPGDTWDGEKFIPGPDPEPVYEPDFQGFLLAAFEQIGYSRTREVLREYPELNIAASRENAVVLRNAFDQALADEFLEQEEYETLQSLMEQYHIPLE